jgi:hypothetical protein
VIIPEVPVSKQMVRLGQIDPNPFRDTGELAFRPDALHALARDIDRHGFWGMLQARVHPDNPERYQLVWGHHRLRVLREISGEDREVPVEIVVLSDEDMLRRLVSENDPAYAGDALTYLQLVRATVEAFGDGRIVLDPVPARTRKTGVRRAPSFVRIDEPSPTSDDGVSDKAFTANTVGTFLGLTTIDKRGRTVAKPLVKELILSCEAIERREVDEVEFRGGSIRAMRRIRLESQRGRAAPPAGPESVGVRNEEPASGDMQRGPDPSQPDARFVDAADPCGPAEAPPGAHPLRVGGGDRMARLPRVLDLRSRYSALMNAVGLAAAGETDRNDVLHDLDAWIADLPVDVQAKALRLVASQLLDPNLAEREPGLHALLRRLLCHVTADGVREEIERAGWTVVDPGRGGRRGRRPRRRRR